jgi:hypothetical protein
VLDSNGELISCGRCKHSVPTIYKNKEVRVCGLANRKTVKCLTGTREHYEPMEVSDEKHV